MGAPDGMLNRPLTGSALVAGSEPPPFVKRKVPSGEIAANPKLFAVGIGVSALPAVSA